VRAAAALILTALVVSTAGCGNDWGTAPPVDAGSPSTAGDTGSLPEFDGEVIPVDAPGITPTEIRVGGAASVTNPLGGRYGDSFDGVQAYFDMVNEQGGVWGRKLVLAARRDDKLASNKAEVDALLSVDKVFAVLPIATLLFTGADRLVREQVPTFGWTINPEWEAKDGYPAYNMFGQSGSYLCFTCASPTLPWLVEQAERTRVGVLAYAVPQSADCADGVRNSFEEYGERTGTELVFVDKSLSYGPSDLSVQVSKMKDAEVDFVTTCMDTNGVVTLAKEMKKQGLDAVQSLPNAYDHTFLEEFGDLFEGSYVRTDFTQFELEDKPEGLQLYLDRIEAAGKQPSENSIAGWLNADLFVQGLEAAGPNFSRKKLIDAINQMTDYDADGVIDGVDWTKGHDQKKSDTRFCQFLSRIEDSEFVTAFSKPGKPFVCAVVTSEGVKTEYSS
jgi:ABC-type branched-subunit amino acid transport system substrate-binding protein